MNLAVRKADFLKVGGYDSEFWPGEDTKLCLDLTQKLHKKIIYEPKAIVFHHRRPLMKPHLHQNGNFGLHRGFFAKVLPQTSRRPIYFLPSFMLLGLLYILVTSILSFRDGTGYINPFLLVRNLGLVLFASYFFALIFNAIWIFIKIYNNRHSRPDRESIKIIPIAIFQSLLSILVIFITHLWYGLRFLQGLLFTAKLER